jgi:16S rRNA (guanine1207-N2)-methyltransferase
MTDHYFSATPSVASEPTSFRLTVRGLDLEVTTDAGVFARGRLDKGTRVLLEHAPEPPTGRGDLLDLGCGYGPITLWLASERRRSTVWAVDVNDRALSLVRANAEAAGLGNVRACRPEEVPDEVRFAGMWSNPPIHSGKPALHELLRRWLPRVDGPSYLVVSKNLGSDSLARWLTEQGYAVERLSSHAGFRILAVEGDAS